MPSEITYEAIMRDVKGRKFKPVYVLMGEESYYIDMIQKAIIENALSSEDRDFCLNIFYGAETTANEVINAARSFPMGERLVVILRNAKELEDIDELSVYLANPQPTTILLLVNKGGLLDKRKKLMTACGKMGVVYSTPKIYDSKLSSIIFSFFRDKGYSIEPKAVSIIAESTGTDLVKLYSEMNKLADAVGTGILITVGFILISFGSVIASLLSLGAIAFTETASPMLTSIDGCGFIGFVGVSSGSE